MKALLPLLLLAACTGHTTAPTLVQPGHIDLARGPDGNTAIVDTAGGLVVVDTGRHPVHSAAIVDYARKVGKPVLAVVNTHWHLDHTTGNRDVLRAFPEAQVITSRAVEGALGGFLARSADDARKALADPKLGADERARIVRSLAAIEDRAALLPGLPITQDGAVTLGGRRIEFHLARAAATEGDVWLVLPDEKLAIVGDLVVAPVPFFDTACEQGWAAALDAIEGEEWERLVPGHGAVMTRADFGRWHFAFTALLDCARSSRSAGECATGWERDAAGFYTPAERNDVLMIAGYYVTQVLRAPAEERMDYCRPS